MTSIITPTHSPDSTTPADHCAPTIDADHVPFSWLAANPKHDPGANLIALTLDVSLGMQTCLELVHSNSLAISQNTLASPGAQVRALLQPSESDRLLRLAMASATLLSTAAESHIEWLNARNVRTVE